MQIELIGCTGAGKSTLAGRIVEACHACGIEVVRSNDFVLQRVGLHWIERRLARTLLLDVISLLTCLVRWRTKLGLYRFTIRTIARLRASWFERLNLARNVFKKIGIHEIVRHHAGDERVVLVDEGSLQAAHNLFVHLSVGVNPADIATFAGLAPLPDVAIYVKEHERVLVERTIARGHKRIRSRSGAQVEVFIRRAIQTFEVLARQPELVGRLLVVGPDEDVRGWPSEGGHPALPRALEILRVGMGALRAERAGPLPQGGSCTTPVDDVMPGTCRKA
jgi:thymidylate kinase